jgi:dTDP-4-dehydrorhamnose reductase
MARHHVTGETMRERWLVTGAAGLLGRELVAMLHRQAMDVVALDRHALDLRDRKAVAGAVREYSPDVVANCAAWTAADAAESDVDRAMAINGTAVRNLAESCADAAATLIHVSTDYVFGGSHRTPYAEDVVPDPCNVYGRTKIVGERAVVETLPDTGYVLRTAWLYGRYGRSFVRTMARLEATVNKVDVVDDQRGQPTWARDVAGRIIQVRRHRAPAGIYHATNAGDTTWWGLAREVFTLLGADPDRVHPIRTMNRGDPAPRPAYSVLGHQRWNEAALPAPRHWREALHEAFPEVVAELAVKEVA